MKIEVEFESRLFVDSIESREIFIRINVQKLVIGFFFKSFCGKFKFLSQSRGKTTEKLFQNGPSNGTFDGPFCVIEKPNSNDVSFVMVDLVTDDRTEL